MATKLSGWLEKECEFNEDKQAEYPYNNVIQSESGHTFEMDDTPGRERVRLQHRKETFIEMHSNGDQVVKVQGNSYFIVISDHNVKIKGQCNITVEGSAVFDIQGDKIERIQGNFQQIVEGDYEVLVKKETKFMSGGDMTLSADPNLAGRMYLMAGSITAYSDMKVDGELSATKVSSLTRVDAGTGVYAGPLGFVTQFGGLSVGFPVAAPFLINCSGPIVSKIVVAAPVGSFGVMGAGLMTDAQNKTIYNLHTHSSYRGPTGPPRAPMV